MTSLVVPVTFWDFSGPAGSVNILVNSDAFFAHTDINFVLVASVADPDQGSGAVFTPGSRMGKKSGSGSGMNNPDQISGSLKKTYYWGYNTSVL